MTLLDSITLLGAFSAGILLGGIFFGGLWLTIRLTLSSAALGLWLVGGFVVRTIIALAGFHAVFAGDWRRLVASLLGFACARWMVARMTKPREGVAEPGVRHAPQP